MFPAKTNPPLPSFVNTVNVLPPVFAHIKSSFAITIDIRRRQHSSGSGLPRHNGARPSQRPPLPLLGSITENGNYYSVYSHAGPHRSALPSPFKVGRSPWSSPWPGCQRCRWHCKSQMSLFPSLVGEHKGVICHCLSQIKSILPSPFTSRCCDRVKIDTYEV